MMTPHSVVLERANVSFGLGADPSFVEGFFLGHRAAEVDNRKECPEGKNLVAYNLGYEYASRLTVRFADPLPKKRPSARNLQH